MAFQFHHLYDDVAYVEVPVSGITSNLYVLGQPGRAVLVDCGAADTADESAATLDSAGWGRGRLSAIVITHAHGDHFGGARRLADWSGAIVCAHLAAAPNIEDHRGAFVSMETWMSNTAPNDWRRFGELVGNEVPVGKVLREGDCIDAGPAWQVMHMPGHERGHIVLFEPDRKLAVVGDIIQGGSDASGNWLGLISDVAGQRASLDRLAVLDAAVLLRGHRRPRAGPEVAQDIASARKRLDAIEAAVIEAISDGPQPVPHIARHAFSRVLNAKVADPPPYAMVTIKAFLIDLAARGLARRNGNWEWEKL